MEKELAQCKKEIIERFNDLDDFSSDLADIITSYYFYKYTEPEFEILDSSLSLNNMPVEIIISQTTENFIPEQIVFLRQLKKDEPDMWDYSCDVFKYSLLYDFNMSIPKWIAVLQTKFQKKYIKVIDGIYSKLNI